MQKSLFPLIRSERIDSDGEPGGTFSDDSLTPEVCCAQGFAQLQSLMYVMQRKLSTCSSLPAAKGFEGYWHELNQLAGESLALYAGLIEEPAQVHAVINTLRCLTAALDAGLALLLKQGSVLKGELWYNHLCHLQSLVQQLISASQQLSRDAEKV